MVNRNDIYITLVLTLTWIIFKHILYYILDYLKSAPQTKFYKSKLYKSQQSTIDSFHSVSISNSQKKKEKENIVV